MDNESESDDTEEKNPFLTIVTRACQRPVFLAKNILSVMQQEDKDVEQIFLVDRERRGRFEADKALDFCHDRIAGEYVYILDDDCRLIDPEFVGRLKKFSEKMSVPDVIMVRSIRVKFAPKHLPHEYVWGHPEKLRVATTNALCYAMRAEVWKEHIHMFGVHAAAGDWHFLGAARDAGVSFGWLDICVAETMQIGGGVLFESVGPGWFEKVAQEYMLEDLGEDDWRFRLYKLDEKEIPRKFSRVIEEPEVLKMAAPQIPKKDVKKVSMKRGHVPDADRPQVKSVSKDSKPQRHSLLERRKKR